jgi:hypothetical protein
MRRRRRPGSGYPGHLAAFDPDLWQGPLLEGERDQYGLPLVGDLSTRDLDYLARQRWLAARFEWATEHGLDVIPELLERVGARREYFGFPPAG